MAVQIMTKGITKELRPLVEEVQFIVEKAIPDSVDNTYIESTIDVRCDHPTIYDRICIFPDVIMCIGFRLKRYKPDIFGELQEDRTEHISLSYHIDTTLWDWELQTYVSGVAEEYFSSVLTSKLTECLLTIVSFAKGFEISTNGGDTHGKSDSV